MPDALGACLISAKFPGLGCLIWETNLLLLSDKTVYEIHSGCGSPHQEWGFLQDHVFASPTHLKVAFLSIVAEALFGQLLGPFQRELLHM